MSASLELTDPLARRLAELMAAGVAVPEGLEAAASEAVWRRQSRFFSGVRASGRR